MNANQKRCWNLLQEIIYICEEKNIPWFLSGRTAIRTYLKSTPFYKGFLDTEMTVPADRAFELIGELEKRGDRVVESLLNNHKFPGFYIKYVDKNTTLIRMNEGESTKYKGIFVKILFLKHFPEDGYQKYDLTERLITETTEQGVDINYTTSSMERKSFYRKRGKNSYTKKIFSELIDGYSNKNSSKVLVNDLMGKNVEMSGEELYDNSFVLFQGYQLRLPENPEKYFEIIAGESWEQCAEDIILYDQEGTMILEGANNLVSSKVSYEELIPLLEKNGLSKSLYKQRIKSTLINRRHQELIEMPNDIWSIAWRAGDLWRIHDIYLPKMNKIRGLFLAGQMDVLKQELEIYDETVRRYMEKDMAFLYSQELHDIYTEVMSAYGMTNDMDRLKELINSDDRLHKQLELFHARLAKESV